MSSPYDSTEALERELSRRFSVNELERLFTATFDMPLAHAVPSAEHVQVVHALVAWCKRRHVLPRLVNAAAKERPHSEVLKLYQQRLQAPPRQPPSPVTAPQDADDPGAPPPGAGDHPLAGQAPAAPQPTASTHSAPDAPAAAASSPATPGSTSAETHDSSARTNAAPREPSKSWRQLAKENTAWAIAAIVVGVITVALGFVLKPREDSHGVSTTPPATTAAANSGATSPPPSSSRALTVRDDVNHGVWALAAPTAANLLPREKRPNNARSWIVGSTKVTISCVQTGTAYGVVLNGAHVRWRWWARAADGTWIPMAAFAETQADGSQGFRAC